MLHRSKKQAHRVVLSLLLLLISGFVNATIIYDESINGDAIQDHPFTKLVLQPGTNLVKGLFLRTHAINDFDYFLFEIPATHRLVKLSWSATGLVEFTTPEPGSGFFELTYQLYDANESFVGALLESVTLDAATPERDFSFVADGLSDWVLLGPDKVVSSGGGFGTYEIRFEVRSDATAVTIPEPATTALMLLALFGLRNTRYRFRNETFT